MSLIPLLLMLYALHGVIGAYKILGIFPAPSKSHYFIGQALLEGLAEDGHEVTIVSPFKMENPPANYAQIFIEKSYDNFVQGIFAANLSFYLSF